MVGLTDSSSRLTFHNKSYFHFLRRSKFLMNQSRNPRFIISKSCRQYLFLAFHSTPKASPPFQSSNQSQITAAYQQPPRLSREPRRGWW
jgi:hypothetical protein